MLLGEAVYCLKNQDQAGVLPLSGKTQVFFGPRWAQKRKYLFE